MAMLAKNPETKKLCQEADRFGGDFDGDGSWIVIWSSIKWYTGYRDLDPIMEFIEALECADLREFGELEPSGADWNGHYRFVRVGEDHDDIQCDGYGDWCIYPETSICVDI